MEKLFDPPVEMMVVDTLADDGGMTPDAPVDEVTAVLEEVENSAVPAEIDMSISRLLIGVAITTVETFVNGGSITPESLVTDVTAVLSETVILPALVMNVGVGTVPLPEGVTETVLAGGIIPEAPVELAVNVLLLVAKVAPPEVTDMETSREMFAVGGGGMTPDA
jgi:hypothetical protein